MTTVASASFRRLRHAMGPNWLVDGEGELVGYALDVIKDAFVQRLFLGLLARMPETSAADGLAAIGRDRRVLRGISETEDEYAQREIRWLDDRKRAGNPFALMQKLAEYTGPLPSFRTVDARGNWFSRAADGTETYLLKQGNWNWDNKPFDAKGRKRWSRFWVIIYPNGLWSPSPNNWGDTAGPGWGESTGTIGSTALPDQVQSIRFLVSDWMPGGTRCVNIILAFDPTSFNPTSAFDAAGMPGGLWERASRNVAGVQVPARLSTARFWDGV